MSNHLRCPSLQELPPPRPGKTGWPWTIGTPAPDPVRTLREWPLISIVTPSLNQGLFLEETIRSVLSQGYPNLEYIIIDGGSTDGSVEIIKKYEPWLAYWVSERDGGQPEAINKGFAACTGELLGFINSDDLYAIGALHEVALTWVQAGRPRDALISGSVQDISATGLPLSQIFKPVRMGTLKEWLAWGISLHQPGCFWTVETWRRFGTFPIDFHYIFDRYFFSKVAAEATSAFLIVNALISFFRVHEGSKTISKSKQFSKEWEAALNRLRTEISFRQSLIISILQWKESNWKFSSKVLAEGDIRSARRLLMRHLMSDPASILLRPILGATRRLIFQSNPKN